MASKKGVTVRRTKGGDSIVVVEPKAAAPIQKREKRTRRRRGGGGGGRFGSLGTRAAKGNRMIAVGIGGMAYGWIEAQWPDMPQIPLLGKSGTVALAVYFVGGNNEIINDIGLAAAAIAGYSLGKGGAISGGYDDNHGLAATT